MKAQQHHTHTKKQVLIQRHDNTITNQENSWQINSNEIEKNYYTSNKELSKEKTIKSPKEINFLFRELQPELYTPVKEPNSRDIGSLLRCTKCNKIVR